MKFADICAKVQNHHEIVAEKYPFVVMTSLVGSQNYKLDTDKSDIDTCSFVLPSSEELMRADPPTGTEFECEDGKCVVKDFRIALNLLLKASPNSVEWFASKYKAYNPDFANTLEWILGNALDEMIYTNYRSMFDACKGLSKQLSKRNMSDGKRVAHLLRIKDLWESYYLRDRPANRILEFRSDKTREEALYAKTHDITNEYIDQKIQDVGAFFDKVTMPNLQKVETRAKETVETLRRNITTTWLHLL